MRCTEFLELYSDFRDGRVQDSALERRVRDHLATCPACMAYDARVSRGVCVLRTLSDLEPSPGWRRALARQVGTRRLQLERPVEPAPAGVMVGLMVATALILLLWTGHAPDANLNTVASQAAEPAPATDPPLPAIVAIPSPPFVSFTQLTAPSFRAEWRTPGSQEETLVGWSSDGR
jgi:hypothetical protein